MEVLAALLLLAVGSASAAGGMVLALRAAHAAQAQQQGLMVVADLAEGLRATAPGGRDGLARLWQAGSTGRLPLAARTGATAEASPIPAAGAWTLRLAWRDRLVPEPNRIELQVVLP